MTLTGDTRPIAGGPWGEWVGAGAERWQVVGRSFTVFSRNTTELMDLLNAPATDVALSLQLMGDDRGATDAFWEELDQRLHNQLASAVSLVDHTRRLLDHYKADVPTLAEEYVRRNAAVTEMNETAFLRDLRNYLLHYGVAPTMQSLDLGPGHGPGATGHSVKLSSASLLKWDKWSARSRVYLSSFGDRDGPVLGRDVAAFANAMKDLFAWLFQQRQTVRGHVPDRFRMDPP